MDPRELQAVLAWSSLPFVGERTLLALMDHAREGRQGLAELWTTPVEDLRRLVALHPKSAAALESGAEERWKKAGEQAREISARGIDPLVPSDPAYPAALTATGKERRWPLLFAYGALGLLDEPRVAIANSRGASHASIAITDGVADALARRDVALVTSTNREAYQAAATAAKRHAAPTVLVLDRSLSGAVEAGLDREPVATARVWDTAFDPDLQLLLSPYAWGEPWSPRSGPRRDALIFALADVVVAVDVRPGGVMAEECRKARERGKTVIALDRGDDTPEGTRSLWEEEPAAQRLAWAGAEGAAGEVLRHLPGQAMEAAAERDLAGWQREIGQFLARACSLIEAHGSPGRNPARKVEVFPTGSPLARIARQWSARDADDGRGPAWLLADLTTGNPGATRPAQLLSRVRPEGLLAAMVPSAWLQNPEHARARATWLEQGTLRLAARLPGAVSSRAAPAAVIVLQQGGTSRGEAPIFSPDREQVGQFHLRRYLQEILSALSASP